MSKLVEWGHDRSAAWIHHIGLWCSYQINDQEYDSLGKLLESPDKETFEVGRALIEEFNRSRPRGYFKGCSQNSYDYKEVSIATL